ncbi:hypothetical protein [Nocardioides sp. LS1]|uniref:hypothetical protein n=1 Tax=Nocardioides sp. LS1 TaxID=1027620 RepID=UPI000F617545|nr:hypothetical protein [Nocardioides sp. LS1]
MTTMLETIVRRSTAVSLASAATLVAVAGPASADVPEGWAPHTEVNGLHAVLVLGGVPLLLFVVIFALGYLPGMLRGERTPGSSPVEDQWFGGPRKGTAELAGPDTDESKAGGASARW